MNRAEARVKSYQNSNSQLNPMKDMHDERNLAMKIGRKKKRK